MAPPMTIDGHAGRKEDGKELEDENAGQAANTRQPQNEWIQFPAVQNGPVSPGKISVIGSGQKDENPREREKQGPKRPGLLLPLSKQFRQGIVAEWHCRRLHFCSFCSNLNANFVPPLLVL